MCFFRERAPIALWILFTQGIMVGQNAPSVPGRLWDPSSAKPPFRASPRLVAAPTLDPKKIYTLSELVNIGEQNNPETHVAWENAKVRAADFGIAQSTLYPTLAAAALADTYRLNIFFGSSFQLQTVETFSPAFTLDYIIFDFGQRRQEISVRANDLLAANFQFNDAHRRVIFQVVMAYYRLLNSKGQLDAADANLKNATTVQQAAEDRLRLGLATLPDVLEARSASAQAEYGLQAAIGATEIAHGDLATAIGVSPDTQFQVESIQDLKIPENIADTVETSIDKALSLRPDLMQRVAELRAAEATVKAERRTYFPTLSFDGKAGFSRSYGQQGQLPGLYSRTRDNWVAELNLTWNIFDMGREYRLAKAHAGQEQAAASFDSTRDQVENEVWSAYSATRTAFRQQKAAAALLKAAAESYNAALESYNFGLRNQIDVVSAQRTLADARAVDVNARVQLLTALVALAYQTGDLLYGKHP